MNIKPLCFLLAALQIERTNAQTDTLKAASLEEVVVTGQYMPQSLKNSVYQVRVIDRERIRLRGASNLQQVLSSEIGFRFSGDNTLGTSDVELMGMSGRNVKILLDGVPMLDRGDTRESLNQIDINSIERIEIVEGPMSVSYGSDALAGVINIITRKHAAGSLSVAARVQEETAGGEYHPFSYKGLHQQYINASLEQKKWNVSAGLTHVDFDGWGGDAYGRAKAWKPKEQWLGNARAGFAVAGFSIYYRIDALDETIKSRGAIGQTYKALDQRYLTDRYMHQVQSAWKISDKMQFNGILSYTDYERRTKTTEHDFIAASDHLTAGAGEQDVARFNSEVLRATLQDNLSSVLALQAGVDINREGASGQRITGTPVITDLALFASSEIKPSSRINIRPGLRFIKNSVYDAPPVVPSLNAKFALSGSLDLRMAYGYGFRSPALRELYFNYQDANHNIVGNKDLKAEHSNSFNSSLSWKAPTGSNVQLATTLSGYYNEFRNLINYAVNPSDPAQYKMINIDVFKTTGVLLENKFTHNNIRLTLGGGYLGRYNQLSAIDKTGLPAFVWSPEVNTSFIYSFPRIGTQVSLFYKFSGKRPAYQLATENGQEKVKLTETGDFHWADLTASKNVYRFFTLSAGCRNLFDVTTLANTAADPGGAHSSTGPIPMAYGRSYFVSLAFQWNKKDK